MMKSVVAVIVALAIGIVGGVLGVQNRMGPRLTTLRVDKDTLERECRRFREKAESASARLEAVQRQNEALFEEIAALETQLDEANMAAAEPAPDETYDRLAEILAGSMAEAPDATGVLEEEQTEAPPRPGSMDEEEARRRAERRRETASRLRDNVRGFMDAQIEHATNPEARERLTALSEYSDYMMDLVQQLRQAQTDEERAAVREALGEARQSAEQLLREQHVYMLREVAAEHGIRGQEQQDAFLQSMRQVLTNPLFNAQDNFWARGAFDYRGPPGGGPGGGQGRFRSRGPRP